MFPWTKREEEDATLSLKAKRFIRAIRKGDSETEAARALGIDDEELRQLRRNPHFRDEVKAARERGPLVPRVVNLDDLVNPQHGDLPRPSTSEARLEDAGWRRL